MKMHNSLIGTMSVGIRGPIIREGDDIVKTVVDTILQAAEENPMLTIESGDIIAVTESAVARAQGNYVTVDEIAADIKRSFHCSKHQKLDSIAVIFPILSRNRFSLILKAIARASKNIELVLKYPEDEQGNRLIDEEETDSPILFEQEFNRHTNKTHPFTGIDYSDLYRKIVEQENCKLNIVFTKLPVIALTSRNFLISNITERSKTYKNFVNVHGIIKLYRTLAEICDYPTDQHGYNIEYGLLGSNLASNETLKLFPRNKNKEGARYTLLIQEEIMKRTQEKVEVIIFGDGAYKDPTSGIWELADPSVYVDATDKLLKRPNEIKIKYLLDNDLAILDKATSEISLRHTIKNKPIDLIGNVSSQGTTPRIFANLVGSLCDLTTGSGDKGTPFVLVKNYFKSYID